MAPRRLAGIVFMLCFCLFAHARAEGKILFLIIAHDSEPHLVVMQNVWRAYMNTDPDRHDLGKNRREFCAWMHE